MRDEYYITKRRVSRDMRKLKARTAWRLAILCWAVVLILVILLSLSGCAASEATEPEQRFTASDKLILGADTALIVTDTETGAEYLFYQSGYAGGLALLTCAEEPESGEAVAEVVYDVYAPWSVSDNHAVMLAKLAWGEARGCSTVEQAAVMWCALNRVDSEDPQFPDYLEDVITQENQFYYSESFPLEHDLFLLALDVLARWNSEHYLLGESGRVLPREYLWFSGDGEHNWFRTTYERNGSNWDWSLPNPYEEGLG